MLSAIAEVISANVSWRGEGCIETILFGRAVNSPCSEIPTVVKYPEYLRLTQMDKMVSRAASCMAGALGPASSEEGVSRQGQFQV